MPHPRNPDPEKYCQFCEKRLERKTINGRLEDYAIFLSRKYCDVLCMAKGMKKAKVGASRCHQIAKKFKKVNCEQCQGETDLAVHHKDGDIYNNVPANLMTLCASCHMKLHWANGKIMPKRPKKVCSICGKKAEARGYCMNHYRHFMKYGDPLLTKKSGHSDGILIKETKTERTD